MTNNKLTVIKVGGKIVEEESTLQQLLNAFASIDGHKILVHGGGRSATKIAEQLGIQSKMIDGRRITDAATLQVVTMVYGGLVNKNIVAGLQSLGVNALGLTGADMDVIRSDKRPVKEIDYGFVGDVKEVKSETLKWLIDKDIVPIMAPLTHDGKGNILNTNADTIAAETAQAMSAHYDVTLIYCFEKKGVLMDENDDESVIPQLDKELYKKYVAEGIITGGMLPKLDNAFRSIEKGVKEVIITQASEIGHGKRYTDRITDYYYMKKWLILIFIFSSFSIMAQLTSDEKSLIRNGSETTPLPVLKITNKKDSLFLRTPSTDFDFAKDKEDIALLISRLRITMALESGVGIAAPQVGIGRNLFLFMRINEPNKPVVAVINPRIVNHPNETICFERDGCLSIPDISGNSIRYPWIDVEYTNENGQLVRERLEGYNRQGNFTGVIFQHEFDHLRGILFIDKLCDQQAE